MLESTKWKTGIPAPRLSPPQREFPLACQHRRSQLKANWENWEYSLVHGHGYLPDPVSPQPKQYL